MDCSICSAMPFILRPPRNSICASCYEGARSIIALTNKPVDLDKSRTNSTLFPPSSSKGFGDALKWFKEMKDLEEELTEKMTFLGGFVAAFRDQLHSDIQLKPGDQGSSIPAHRAVLATRSIIFRNMLDADGCKAAPNDTITLPELNYEELESLLEFLYSGHLSEEKVEKHVYALSTAADKYEIPFLQRFCGQQMLKSLNASNALDILEISDNCCNQSLKETALDFIVKNMEDVVFTSRFDAFALRNPHLTVQITRASFMDIKYRRNGVVRDV
ncbi:BTB/POZ domain-containing protein At3g56230-like [Apium graveolens]|uniref:BTB/POZ domain-containing protein At3g56230-like n=1 Tax=Apium graveolens TaxID=4045 RepID=UPI003D7A5017